MGLCKGVLEYSNFSPAVGILKPSLSSEQGLVGRAP